MLEDIKINILKIVDLRIALRFQKIEMSEQSHHLPSCHESSPTGEDGASDLFLAPSHNTFTLDRLGTILRNERPFENYKSNARIAALVSLHGRSDRRCEIDGDNFAYERTDNGDVHSHTQEDAKLRAISFCQELYGHTTPVSISVNRLDDILSRAFRFRFEPLEDSEVIIEETCNLLKRLSAVSPELTDTPSHMFPEYHASCMVSGTPKRAGLWNQLLATTYVSSVVLRSALAAVTFPSSMANLPFVLNVLAALLEITSRLRPAISDPKTLWRSFIARAFLWTSWQWCQLIYFYLASSSALSHGSSDGKRDVFTLRGTFPASDLSVQEMSK